MKALKDINANKISGIYLFYGPEKYKLKVYKDALKKNVPYENQMNYSYFEGKDIDLQAVYDSVVTLPFFAEKRLVIVEDSGLFKNKSKKDSEEQEDDNDNENKGLIEKIIEERPDTTCLVFLEENASKAKKLYKKIASAGVAEECQTDSVDVIAKWVKKGFATYGKDISAQDAAYLVERCGPDYTMLLNEIEKLSAYTATRDVVTTEDINAVSIKTIESKIFDIMDSMCDKRCADAIDKYYDLLANREEPLMILAMIRRQFRILLQVCEEAEKGCGSDQISHITGYKTFIIKKMMSYFKRFENKYDIIDILDMINDTDRKIKSGELDAQIAVELLLVKASG